MSGNIPPFNGFSRVTAFISGEGDQASIRGIRIIKPILGLKCEGQRPQEKEACDVYVSGSKQNDSLLAPHTPFTILQAFVMTADLNMFYTGDSLLTHGTIVTHPVFRELTFFLNQYI